MLRNSGVLRLPSERTLRDYTYHTEACTGFSVSVDRQLQDLANITSCPERDKYVIIILDEMHIRADIVYDKHTGTYLLLLLLFKHSCGFVGAIQGFTDLGHVNNHLLAYEKTVNSDEEEEEEDIAKSMLVVMVRGIFSKLQFAYAQFPCVSLCGVHVQDIFWQAVQRLERSGFRVIGCTCDGLSVNRSFFKLHGERGANPHKCLNRYAEDETCHIYFLCDPPHLMKTTRNCWSSSKRLMWVCLTM